jgi:hypothetical protein
MALRHALEWGRMGGQHPLRGQRACVPGDAHSLNRSIDEKGHGPLSGQVVNVNADT